MPHIIQFSLFLLPLVIYKHIALFAYNILQTDF